MKKRLMSLLTAMLLISGPSLFAEAIDKVWIIEENTGSISTMQERPNPALSPGETVEVLIQVRGLSTRWGEGYAKWSYSYLSESGRKIWISDSYSQRERSDTSTWDFARVATITLPRTIPEGRYRLAFYLQDFHSGKLYQGHAGFSIGGARAAESQAERGEEENRSPQTETAFEGVVDTVELELRRVSRTGNRLLLLFNGLNRGTENKELRLYPYTVRIIDANGQEYRLEETGGGGNLTDGVSLPPEVPMELELFFRPPATQIEQIQYLQLDFYGTKESLNLRAIPVPWP